jgi:hypothetical protein
MPTPVATGSAAEHSTMSSQPIFAEAASSQSSLDATAKQSKSGDAQHSASGAVTKENLQDNIDAVNKTSISHEPAKCLNVDMMFEEKMANIRARDDPLHKLVVRYHEAINKVRANEQQCMKTVQDYHSELEEFTRRVKDQKPSQDELDRQMDEHSDQLKVYDMHLAFWFDIRAKENDLMVHNNNCLVEDNNRRIQEIMENARWVEEHNRNATARCRSKVFGCRRMITSCRSMAANLKSIKISLPNRRISVEISETIKSSGSLKRSSASMTQLLILSKRTPVMQASSRTIMRL